MISSLAFAGLQCSVNNLGFIGSAKSGAENVYLDSVVADLVGLSRYPKEERLRHRQFLQYTSSPRK